MLFLFLKHYIWFSHLVLRLPTRWNSESVYFFISLQPSIGLITFLWFNVLKERARYKKNKLSLSHGQSLCQCLWWRHMTKLFLPIADITEDTEPWTSSLTKLFERCCPLFVSSECVPVRFCTDIYVELFYRSHFPRIAMQVYNHNCYWDTDCRLRIKKKMSLYFIARLSVNFWFTTKYQRRWIYMDV